MKRRQILKGITYFGLILGAGVAKNLNDHICVFNFQLFFKVNNISWRPETKATQQL
jgi:hypothetical protein